MHSNESGGAVSAQGKDNPITVTRKRLWKGRQGDAVPHLFVDIRVEPGLVIRNLNIWGNSRDDRGSYQLPVDGIFIEPENYHVHFPAGGRYPVTVGNESYQGFKRLFFEAVNAAPLTHSPMYKTAPPANWRKRMQRGRQKGKVPVLLTGLTARQAARHIRNAGLSKPTFRWFEGDGRGHCLVFYFRDEKEAAVQQAISELEVLREEHNHRIASATKYLAGGAA